MTTIYTYSEARQNLASLLDEATEEGEVLVQRRDGRMFAIRPVAPSASPLDVDGINIDMTADEIMAFIAEGRRYGLPEGKE